MTHVILVSPQSQLDLDFGLLWVWYYPMFLISLSTWSTSPPETISLHISNFSLEHSFIVKNYVVANAIIVSPQSQLDFDLGLLWVWV